MCLAYMKWEPHVQNLTRKLKSAEVTIKRIIKFIPKSEYMKIYDALFKSQLSYCISSWGAIPSAKLQCIFSIQKRCIRLVFGTEYTYDHSGPEHLRNTPLRKTSALNILNRYSTKINCSLFITSIHIIPYWTYTKF